MVSKSDLRKIAASRIAPRVDVDGELILDAHTPGDRSLYSLRVKNAENGGETVIGPHGHAAEFEYFLRGVYYGLELADGRYSADGDSPGDD